MIQQHHHTRDAKTSRGRWEGRVDEREREDEEHISGRQAVDTAMATTAAHAEHTTVPGLAKPRHDGHTVPRSTTMTIHDHHGA
jgi:hypothetical protein